MKKLLEFLLTGCFHEWEILGTVKVYAYDPFAELDSKTKGYLDERAGQDIRDKYNIPSHLKYTLRCKKCGEMKTYHDY